MPHDGYSSFLTSAGREQDFVTEHPERFFVAEIIREKIFLLYREEIPYAATVSLCCPSAPPSFHIRCGLWTERGYMGTSFLRCWHAGFMPDPVPL